MKIVSQNIKFNKDVSKSSAVVKAELEVKRNMEIKRNIKYYVTIEFKKSKLLGDEFLKLMDFFVRERKISQPKKLLELLKLTYNDFIAFASWTIANACEIAVKKLLELGINIKIYKIFVSSVGFRSSSAWVNISFEKGNKRFIIPKLGRAFVFINILHLWEQYLKYRNLEILINKMMYKHEALLKPSIEFWVVTLIHEFIHILDPSITSKHGEFYLKSKHSNIWKVLNAREDLIQEGFAELSTIILNPNVLTTKNFYEIYKLAVNTDFDKFLTKFTTQSNEGEPLDLTAAAYIALLSILDSLISKVQSFQVFVRSLLNFLRFRDYVESVSNIRQALNNKELQSVVLGVIKKHLGLKQESAVLMACENIKKYNIKTRLAKSLIRGL